MFTIFSDIYGMVMCDGYCKLLKGKLPIQHKTDTFNKIVYHENIPANVQYSIGTGTICGLWYLRKVDKDCQSPPHASRAHTSQLH